MVLCPSVQVMMALLLVDSVPYSDPLFCTKFENPCIFYDEESKKHDPISSLQQKQSNVQRDLH